MHLSSSFSFLVIFLSLVKFGCGWVFTDVNYNQLLKAHGEVLKYDDDVDNEVAEVDMTKLKFSLIYPGTKWCGPGNVAESYDDLGLEEQADMCCREHDICPDIMAAGETKHNLTNNAYYTRLHCDCDNKFRQCLHNANSSVAEQIGTIYFNAIGTKCFKKYYPITGCRQWGGWFSNKCLQYSFDKQGEKVFQWFDVPNY